jgi:hypothetical protein
MQRPQQIAARPIQMTATDMTLTSCRCLVPHCWTAPVTYTFSPIEHSGQGRWTLFRQDQRKPWAERDLRPYAEALLLPNLDAGVGLR